jgi:7-cyano-7-deazaguanine synthase in queuosine biosynthesis
MTRCAFAADGATIEGGTLDLSRLLRFEPGKQKPNVQLYAQEVIDAIGRPLTDLENDWLDVLRIIYVADILCERERNEGWNRTIALGLPVRDPGRVQQWLPLLRELFNRMAHDALNLKVEPMTHHSQARYPSKPDLAVPNFDAVALLSGGLDSAFGAVDVVKTHANPCLVGARSSPHIGNAQEAVIEALAKFNNNIHSARFRVVADRRDDEGLSRGAELSQRSRTLLYAGVAAMIATAHGVREVTLAENGIMAINCPLTTGRAGGFSTHTAHPQVLSLMSELFTLVFGTDITVQNPLLRRTKTDVVRGLVRAGLGDVIPKTHSCWKARQKDHCGTCVPCLVRRFATMSAGAHDVKYVKDVFRDPPAADHKDFETIGDYVLYARNLSTAADDDLLLDHTEFNIDGGWQAQKPLLDAHRKWVTDVLEVAEKFAHLREFA